MHDLRYHSLCNSARRLLGLVNADRSDVRLGVKGESWGMEVDEDKHEMAH